MRSAPLEFGTAGMRGIMALEKFTGLNQYTIRSSYGVSLFMDSLGEETKNVVFANAYDSRQSISRVCHGKRQNS